MKAEDWISVKDRLPKQEQTVIGFGYGEVLIGKIYSQNTSDGYDCVSERKQLYEVTHWMPFVPPKDHTER